MSCNGQYIQCPAIPLKQVIRRALVNSTEGVGFFIDIHYVPTEIVLNCGNGNLQLSQLIGQAIIEHSEDGLPVFRAYACF